MLIESPPFFYRALFPGGYWRIVNPQEKTIYLTFDDGPIPEMTPWVLEVLKKYNIKATFFCVGDNVRKHPEVYKMVLDAGHRVGNHTFNHIQGIKTRTKNYLKNTDKAREYIDSDLFRPPHGHMRVRQFFPIKKKYRVILWDVVTRDYSKYMTSKSVFENVKKYTRDGSIIVFHDSLKSEHTIKEALPKSIEWLIEQGYNFKLIP